MLDFTQFKQLKDLNELKSRQTPKFIVLPEDLNADISYKTLLSESTWSDLKDRICKIHYFIGKSYYISRLDEFSLISLNSLPRMIMIDFDEKEREDILVTFENDRVFEEYLTSRSDSLSNVAYLELDDQMIEYLTAETRKDQIDFYDRKIAKAKLDIKLATKALEEYEELKGNLLNERK